MMVALAALALCAAIRSAVATRLDGFTLDEAYHVTAGVAYARTGDYRLNPEHPPLTKLWVGAWLTDESFQLPPFRALQDKPDERDFTNEAVFLKNDPDRVQRRVRAAMLTLHALLLFAFALAAWRALGRAVAFAALAYLVIDPTVAAHLPVVMTDLSVALLATTALLLSVLAFRSWRAVDLTLASLALGLALGSQALGARRGGGRGRRRRGDGCDAAGREDRHGPLATARSGPLPAGRSLAGVVGPVSLPLRREPRRARPLQPAARRQD
jgi:hypothetical protein